MTGFVVVGGGIAGLVVARRLALGGAAVTLLEASDRIGGSVTHHVVGRLVLDAGTSSFSTARGTVAALAAELGLGGEIVTPEPLGFWLHQGGSPTPMPAGGLLGIPGAPLARDVSDVVGLGAAFRAYFETLLPSPVGAEATSLGGLVEKRMGRTVVDRLVSPLAEAMHSASAYELDLAEFAPGVRHGMLQLGSLATAVRSGSTEAAAGAVAGIRGGVHRLVDELGADLERVGVDVRLGVRVDSVEADAAVAGSETVRGTVVVATPGVLSRGEPNPVVFATLVLEDERLDAAPRGSGVAVVRGAAGVNARAMVHETARWGWLAERADGRHVVRLLYDRPAVADEALAEASALFGFSIPSSNLVDFAAVEWLRHPHNAHAADGIPAVAAAAGYPGIATITSSAEALAVQLLGDAAG